MKLTDIVENVFAWLLDRENVTFLIAIISFLTSAYVAIRDWAGSRETYNIKIIDYAFRRSDVIQFLVCLSNNSDIPLTITEISTFGTICELFGKKIRGKPEEWNFQHTADFPICIPARGCQYAYLEFCGGSFSAEQLTPGKKVAFEIRSTQKLVQKTAILGNESHYLHARSQPQYLQVQD